MINSSQLKGLIEIPELKAWNTKYNYNFVNRPIHVQEIRKVMINDKTFKQALQPKSNKNNSFYGDIKYASKNQNQSFLSICGYMGTGKSFAGIYIALKIAESMKTKFTANNIYFTNQDLLEGLRNSKKGEVFMMDEQTQRMGLGSMEEKYKIQNIEATVREKQVNFVWVSPQIKTHLHFCYLETIAIDFKKELCLNAFFSGHDELLGNVITKKPKDENLLKNYMKNKRANYQKLLNQDHYSEFEFIKVQADSLLSNLKIDLDKKYTKKALKLEVMKYCIDMNNTLKDLVIEYAMQQINEIQSEQKS